MEISRKKITVWGGELKREARLDLPKREVLYRDRDRQDSFFTLNEELFSRHILMLGGSGSGKTNVFNLTMNQLRARNTENDIFIVFDTKGDFYRRFGEKGDIVLGNSREYRASSARWNLFDEVLSDGTAPEDYELNAKEMAASLFAGRGSETQPFFANAARDIFANVIIYFIRCAEENSGRKKLLNNKKLIQFFRGADSKKYVEIFQRYADMKSLLSYIGDGTGGQALGVLGELKSMVNDCFIGVFQEDDQNGRFSIRNAVGKKGGKAIFIEYDLTVGEVLTPIYRLLIDLALKEALGRSENEKGNVYLVLDELKLLPKLQHLDDALNFGRSMGVKVIAGLQSVNQLYDSYGQEKGTVIAGGFGTVFAFRTSDNASREYISGLFGRNVVSFQYTGIDRQPVKREREGYVVESWDQLALKKGQAVIGIADEPEPFVFQFEYMP